MREFHSDRSSLWCGSQIVGNVANHVLKVSIIEFGIVQASLRNAQLVEYVALELSNLDFLSLLDGLRLFQVEDGLHFPEFEDITHRVREDKADDGLAYLLLLLVFKHRLSHLKDQVFSLLLLLNVCVNVHDLFLPVD